MPVSRKTRVFCSKNRENVQTYSGYKAFFVVFGYEAITRNHVRLIEARVIASIIWHTFRANELISMTTVWPTILLGDGELCPFSREIIQSMRFALGHMASTQTRTNRLLALFSRRDLDHATNSSCKPNLCAGMVVANMKLNAANPVMHNAIPVVMPTNIWYSPNCPISSSI